MVDLPRYKAIKQTIRPCINSSRGRHHGLDTSWFGAPCPMPTTMAASEPLMPIVMHSRYRTHQSVVSPKTSGTTCVSRTDKLQPFHRHQREKTPSAVDSHLQGERRSFCEWTVAMTTSTLMKATTSFLAQLYVELRSDGLPAGKCKEAEGEGSVSWRLGGELKILRSLANDWTNSSRPTIYSCCTAVSFDAKSGASEARLR